ncbi:hypothetical protein Tco_1488882 [Tanacetum coccineum]
MARLMVSELAMHNERAIGLKKVERLAFLEIKMSEVELRERELAMQEYRQRHEDKMFYMQPYDHLTGDALNRMEALRAKIKANTYPEGSPCQPRIDASMRQNPTDSHFEGKPPRRDSNLRPLACGNNLPKDTFGGH